MYSDDKILLDLLKELVEDKESDSDFTDDELVALLDTVEDQIDARGSQISPVDFSHYDS